MRRKSEQPAPKSAGQSDLFARVVNILEQARGNVVRTVNSQMVIAYWLIGREIVEEIQAGSDRAGYGKRLLADLSEALSERFGKGFSVPNLKLFRQFYQSFHQRSATLVSGDLRIRQTGVFELDTQCVANLQRTHPQPDMENSTHCVRNSSRPLHSSLGWSHYRVLMRIKRIDIRDFYEMEAIEGRWSVRELERQINSLLYERLLKARDPDGVRRDTLAGSADIKPIDVIKDPYVLEFLDLPESHKLVESKIEQALIGRLQEFLLELGTGFAFVGRQKRLTLEGDHFYPDLVFYHTKLKCYVVIDLKTDKLTPQDLGQMLMYVHYYDREIREADDNPTVGLILCTDKNDAVVEYVLDDENRRIFASRYQLYLPTEEELRRELIHEHHLLMEEAAMWDLAGEPGTGK
ncbi:MAG: PDDEXK nuclease domain-containing protein [Lentisphaeria bacterium]|nr:PDDEXK nuclease domain-containing protein [Lentisphaeria bacterium]